jgi:nitrite reductase (NADH) small subunit
MSDWIHIANTSDIPAGEAREFVAAGRMVALFHAEGQFYALDGICPHQGGPLGKGVLSGCTITCPWHGWQYDVRTGRHLSIESLVQPQLQVQVRGEEILIRFDEEDRGA